MYLQPVEMELDGHMRKASESDIHLEADIHALGSNVNGYAGRRLIPYLLVGTKSPSKARARPSAAT